jgi:hypothetical protein
MMKFNPLSRFLRSSIFVIPYSAVYPPQAGSLLNFYASCLEITDEDSSISLLLQPPVFGNPLDD